MKVAVALIAAIAAAAATVACTNQNAQVPTPSPTSPAQSAAADMRTHIDLLLGEQVMIVAKESAAAVNHASEYAAYTSLLATNSADITALMARAYGNTSAVEFAQLWNAQNASLVDYAIGVVTHNDDKAAAAMTSLNTTLAPQLAELVAGLSGLPAGPLTQLLNQQVLEDKAFIDDAFSGSYAADYADLHRAYVHSLQLGDPLAKQMATRFPDKFPGDPAAQAVDHRVGLNLALQEHSYLITMATDAAVAKRDSDRAAVVTALGVNATAIGALLNDERIAQAWSQQSPALNTYATAGDQGSKKALSDTFTSQLSTVARATSAAIAYQVTATLKVIDDQRANAASVAGDDRAAATAMEPIADSVQS